MRSPILMSTILSASRFFIPASTSSICPAAAQRLFTHINTCNSNNRLFSTSQSQPSKMSPNSAALLEAFKGRRSIYQLTKDLPISKEQITAIIKEAVVQTPSSFNSQSNRVLVLHGAEHEKLWDLTSETLKAIVPADAWEATAQRNAGYKAGAGTVLFFINQTAVKGMQEKFALYADRFPTWAEHSSAMLQFAAWTALEADGLGASLQHYNPLIDAKVTSEWNIPSDWVLVSQLVFGGRGGEAGAKEHLPLEETVKVAGL
ncbi:Nitroreductase [Xylaria sp. CBS 124048]|nr:Nitroreductase [Xylaria sp. CBS 124048]